MRPLIRFLALIVIVPALTAAAPIAITTGGAVQGLSANGVNAYLGIPYAAPPVGELRWRAAEAVKPWTGVRTATAFGPSCWQAVSPDGFGPWTHEYAVTGKVSEDCLSLNVWAPIRPRRPVPVLVWVHGGAFNSGSGSVPIYEGAALAKRGIIVVTINYRVNIFGFFAHPELSEESAGTTNFGLQDVVAALRWVHENIGAFGGDPAEVTLAGQSAGAIAVHMLMAAPSARGLFQRAIVESGFPNAEPPPGLVQAERDGLAFANEKDAPALAALRRLPAEALQPSHGNNTGRFGPTVDGKFVPMSSFKALRSGQFTDVPVLAGFNADEDSAVGPDYGSGDKAVFDRLLRESFGPLASRAAHLYPRARASDKSASTIELRRDQSRASLYGWAKARAQSGKAPVYAYIFTHIEPGKDSARWRAFHSSEIPYVFGTLDAAPERGFAAADRALSDRIAGYWVNFVKTGNPNEAGLPAWPRLQFPNPKVMELGRRIAPQPLLEPAKRRLFDPVLEKQTR